MPNWVKYPRTYHLPWSPGLQNDDRLIEDLSVLRNCQDIIITQKMDGESTTCYRDHYHARSLDSKHHPSRDWMKSFHGQIKHLIPENIRICGENLFAKHSLFYDDLPSYFLGFSAWDNDQNICLSWDDTLELFEMLGITPVEVLYRGPWYQFWFDSYVLPDNQEGYVVRDAGTFHYSKFQTHCVKYVRRNHVQTTEHWMSQAVVPNKLRLTKEEENED